MTYTVIYEKGPTSWGAYVPDLPGVISVGDSRDEVEPPSSFAGVVEVDPAA